MVGAAPDPKLLRAVRDCLAGQFALAIGTERKAVMEVLEHQLGDSANHDKWSQLHAALETLRARLNWLSPVQGACVFKETARNRSFALSLADLARERGIDPRAVHAG